VLNGKNIGAVIAAAGAGTRMGISPAKQFLELQGKAVLVRTLEAFERSPVVDLIVVSSRGEDIRAVKSLVGVHNLSKVVHVVEGGAHRQDSVWKGIERLSEHGTDIVLIHDAVRPFVRPELIHSVTLAACEYGAAICAIRPKDTVKLSNEDVFIDTTLNRNQAWLAQTPQAFQIDLFCRAYADAVSNKFFGTDDAILVERIGGRVKIVEGSYENIKITTPEDFALAGLIAHSFFK
jgi:2-C-methyl-D-erythritol 4-phosphate cytidylyltransferase